jgi:hypothetical protein
MKSALDNLKPEQRRVVRERVRALLQKSPAFTQMAPGERSNVANGLVNVVAYLADPNAGQGAGLTGDDKPDARSGTALALAEAPQSLASALAGPERQGQQQNSGFGKATRAGVDAYDDLVNAIDFPKFVSSLIDGVFDSIVDASIRQMDAYGKLLEAVVKSVDQFASDNFSLNQGRDWLANRVPNQLKIEVDGDQPRLAPTSAGEDSGLADIKQQLGLEQDIDLSEPESEAELARRAQLEMARLRQKQLATMVLMGINRIIVTDGLINAKVVIDVKANDKDTKVKNASSFDDDLRTRQSGSGGGWFSSDYDNRQSTHRTLIQTSSTATSESEVEAKAKLTGEVKVAFKSQTVDLNLLASQSQLDTVNQVARK